MASQPIKWVLVAGTGTFKLAQHDIWAAQHLGRVLAEAGYGLVTGGWQGVDYVVAEAFREYLGSGTPLASYLIQVVPEGKEPVFRGGHVVYVEAGAREWTESVRYADAVVLVGGLGGTYETYQFAQLEMKPVFAFPATQGDARRAFEHILANWTEENPGRLSKEEYTRVLDVPIASPEDAGRACERLVELLAIHFSSKGEVPAKAAPRFDSAHSTGAADGVDGVSRTRVFISYSHKDGQWLERLRLMIKPLERRGLEVWADTDIEAGQKWKDEITGALQSTAMAVFLVSPNFVASEFITTHELPPLLAAADQNHVKILWVYLSACLYDETALSRYQAAHDISEPLDGLSPAQQNEQLVKVAKLIRSQAALSTN